MRQEFRISAFISWYLHLDGLNYLEHTTFGIRSSNFQVSKSIVTALLCCQSFYLCIFFSSLRLLFISYFFITVLFHLKHCFLPLDHSFTHILIDCCPFKSVGVFMCLICINHLLHTLIRLCIVTCLVISPITNCLCLFLAFGLVACSQSECLFPLCQPHIPNYFHLHLVFCDLRILSCLLSVLFIHTSCQFSCTRVPQSCLCISVGSETEHARVCVQSLFGQFRILGIFQSLPSHLVF